MLAARVFGSFRLRSSIGTRPSAKRYGHLLLDASLRRMNQLHPLHLYMRTGGMMFSLVEHTHRRHFGAMFMMLVGILVMVGSLGVGQPTDIFPDCAWSCGSNDVEVTAAWLELPGGVCESCVLGTTVFADLKFTLRCNAASDRKIIVVSGFLYVGAATTPTYIELCTAVIAGGATTTITYPGAIAYTCGEEANLDQTVVSWLPPGGKGSCFDPFTCKTRKAKCYGPDFIPLIRPITANVTPDPPDVCINDALQLNGNPFGGTEPYVTHAWSGGGAAYLSSTAIENPVFLCSIPGTYDLIYTVTDTNGCTASDTVSIAVNDLPACSISTDVELCAGAQYTATGPAGMSSYTWGITNGAVVSGQGTNTLTYAAGIVGTPVGLTLDLVSVFGCSSNCAISIPVINCCVPPTIVTHPVGGSCISAGANVDLSVTATGTSPLAYQWYKGGSPILSGTSSTYSIVGGGASDDGDYHCVVTNACGSATSNTASLDFNAPPVADAGPDQPAVVEGDLVTLDGSGSYDNDFGDSIASYATTTLVTQSPVMRGVRPVARV